MKIFIPHQSIAEVLCTLTQQLSVMCSSVRLAVKTLTRAVCEFGFEVDDQGACMRAGGAANTITSKCVAGYWLCKQN